MTAALIASFAFNRDQAPAPNPQPTISIKEDATLPPGYWLERDIESGLYRQCHVLILDEPMCGAKFSKETAIQQANNWHAIDIRDRTAREGKWEKVTQ